MRILMSLPWKGNIRELDNVLERAMILGDGQWIKPADLPGQRSNDEDFATEDNLAKAIELYEKSQGRRRQNARCRGNGAESLNTLSQDRKARRRILSVTPQPSAKMKPSFI
jgi:DNA-binding NtrC family response regulator